jgi:crotonobetainyl-CoA:carnitine CoA-transferase CaiB-like acyl-CoA transferase
VRDAGTSPATAQAARILGALGAMVASTNPSAALLADGAQITDADDAGPDIVLDDGTTGVRHSRTVDVQVAGAGGPTDDSERRLQEGFGLAALTGEPDGEALLVGGWPALLHCGAQAAVAALLSIVARERSAVAPQMIVDARTTTLAMLDDAPLRFLRGHSPRPRTRGARFLERNGRLARASDGWVSLSMSRDDEWETVTALARRADCSSVTDWIAQHSRRQVFDILQAMRLACGMGLTPAEVLDDPLLRERGAVRDGRVVSPFRCELRPGSRWSPPAIADEPPLQGIRVVELAGLWAGPAATEILARWGATVVKVESPQRLDGFRDDEGTRFETFNAGKRSVLLDLGGDAGRAALHALLRSADVLVEAHAPRVLPNWGLDAPALRTLNPSLVVLHLPALGGEPDTWPQHVAYGFDQEMLCGQAVIGADAPVRPAGVPLGDPVAATAAAAAVLAGLWQRMRSGAVAHFELAQRDVLLHHLAPRCEAARHGRAWAADALAGVSAASPQTAGEALAALGTDGGWDQGIRMLGTPWRAPARAPRPGEHTAAELRRAGVS